MAETTEEGASLFEGIVEVETPKTLDIVGDTPEQDADLTESDKEVFTKLLNEALPLEERARKLAHLARMKGAKTAGVGLRALVEINRLTGVSNDGPLEAPPIFQLPAGTSVSVTIKKVGK